ncbi:GGDEF domain-containing protein, partial [Shewanella sp. GutDb-MelDb]|uniref:GGDEF domain-containing protein n=1 Tax=Shewanella sp. GutDb-MelDb TaxID=2058316 RepID=UPI000CB83BCF
FITLILLTFFVIYFFNDFIINTEKTKTLEKKVYFDNLTGLLNRAYFESNEFHIFYNQPDISVIMIDGNGIKKVNDNYGHSSGDLGIKHIANSVNKCCRDTDLCFRLGGDEFLILAAVNLNNAIKLSRRIKTEVSKDPISIYNIIVSVSCGTVKKTNNESIEELIHRADTALYKDKNTFYDKTVIARKISYEYK